MRRLSLTPEALTLLQTQHYRGNVRELRNLLERASLLCDGAAIEASHVQQALQSGRRVQMTQLLVTGPEFSETSKVTKNHIGLNGALQKIEHVALQQLIASHQGSRAELAARLGISQRSLYRKLKALES